MVRTFKLPPEECSYRILIKSEGKFLIKEKTSYTGILYQLFACSKKESLAKFLSEQSNYKVERYDK